MASKHFGPTVNCYLDGQGYDSAVTITCDHNGEFDWKCPFALNEIMPMESGMRCIYSDCGNCRVAEAKIDALKKAKAMIAAKIKELEEQLEY